MCEKPSLFKTSTHSRLLLPLIWNEKNNKVSKSKKELLSSSEIFFKIISPLLIQYLIILKITLARKSKSRVRSYHFQHCTFNYQQVNQWTPFTVQLLHFHELLMLDGLLSELRARWINVINQISKSMDYQASCSLKGT